MKQYTFAFSNANELQLWLEKLPSNTYMDKLATLYIPYNFYEFQWAINILTKHCIKVVGCTSQLSIINSSLNDLRIILCLQCFTDTKIHILQFEDTNEESIKMQLDKFHNLSIPGMQIFSINCCSSIEKCIELIYQILNNTFIFGGLVGKGTSLQNTPNNELSYNEVIFTNDSIKHNGLICILYESKSLKFIHRIGNGWKALGPQLKITKMSNQVTIDELDNKPAIQLYEKYLNIKNDNNFFRNTTIFPIEVVRNGVHVVRQPYICNKDGSLQFVASFSLGESIQLVYGDLNCIIQESRKNQEELATLNLEGILYFSCYDRFISLGNDLSMELILDDNLISSAGFYTYGEIISSKHAPVIQNKSQVIVGMREGEIKEKYHYLPKIKEDKFSEQNETLSRMMFFINAVTQDMNQQNQKLAYLAKIDRLTELLNRGETESLLHSSIQYANNTSQPLSILMIDVDNFKDINDIYGHDMGDTVLKEIAYTIRRNIRSLDFAGRWGGDEFFVILPNIVAKQSTNIAKRIRKQLYKLNITKEKITTSIGIASLTQDETIKTFCKRVDVALYQAKKKYKKNCIVVIDKNKNFELVRGD